MERSEMKNPSNPGQPEPVFAGKVARNTTSVGMVADSISFALNMIRLGTSM
jgi:hypothetical protein